MVFVMWLRSSSLMPLFSHQGFRPREQSSTNLHLLLNTLDKGKITEGFPSFMHPKASNLLNSALVQSGASLTDLLLRVTEGGGGLLSQTSL